MSTQGQSDRSYPSWEQLKESGVEVKGVPELRRLRENWILTSSWQDLFVKEDNSRRASVSPYFNKDTGALHEIASIAVCEPKVSSVIVTEGDLNGYFSDLFQEKHYYHIDENGWVDPVTMDPAWTQVEIPADYNFHDEDRKPLYCFKIRKCCGEPRPEDIKATVTVKASADGPGYVTIHDYITSVHPWLLTLEDLILPNHRELTYPKSKYGPTQMDDLWVNCEPVSKCFLHLRPWLNKPVHGSLGYGQKAMDKYSVEKFQEFEARAEEITRMHRENEAKQAAAEQRSDLASSANAMSLEQQ